MKYRTFIFLILLSHTFSFCQNSDIGIWRSSYSDLQLKFDNHWQIIKPYLDSEDKILVGIIDQTDHSSIVVKITKDVSKDQVSDEKYNNAIKEQMLKGNPDNKLLVYDEIDFKGIKFTRHIFLLKIKFGDFLLTSYTCRNGKKAIGIQFSYPKNQSEKLVTEIPSKIEKVLTSMKI